MAATTLTYLDSYCERAGEAGAWAEPLNLLTNLAFILAAFALWRLWRITPGRSFRNEWDILLLLFLLALIGLGSAAWHYLPNRYSLLMDVIPIGLFMNIYLLSAAVRLLRWRWVGTLGLFAAFQILTYLTETHVPAGFLGGSMMYGPAYAVLVFFAAMLWRKSEGQGRIVLAATALFTLSITLRTLDMPLCATVPLGTHFLWHMLNALVLYLLMRALMPVFHHSAR
jgi:hypothetical protein